MACHDGKLTPLVSVPCCSGCCCLCGHPYDATLLGVVATLCAACLCSCRFLCTAGLSPSLRLTRALIGSSSGFRLMLLSLFSCAMCAMGGSSYFTRRTRYCVLVVVLASGSFGISGCSGVLTFLAGEAWPGSSWPVLKLPAYRRSCSCTLLLMRLRGGGDDGRDRCAGSVGFYCGLLYAAYTI